VGGFEAGDDPDRRRDGVGLRNSFKDCDDVKIHKEMREC
jgi:hypothetical protein